MLAARFARGEIDAEEYEGRLATLRDRDDHAAPLVTVAVDVTDRETTGNRTRH
ncbi:hypothetical protein [Actinoplanes subglobosus]|uniref:SHOCT domain-containing protein n=1 Tax=Actinoplanes subglobosus TaxID=1547892 RepID=A0ABV8IRJ6_9ACTN